MRDFNLELAKQGHPVCTRDGRPARVICWDCKNHMGEDDTPIVALVQLSDRGEYPYCYYENGLFTDRHTDKRDLMMAPVKHEGWINIVKTDDGYQTLPGVYDTEDEAIRVKHIPLITVKIEWKE